MINEKELYALYKKKRKKKIIIILFMFIVIVAMCLSFVYLNHEHIFGYFSKPEVVLNTDDYVYKHGCFEIGASQSSDLDINELIKSYNSSYKTSIGKDKATQKSIEQIKKNKVGSYKLTFIFSNQYSKKNKTIKIKIIDDISPDLELSTDNIEININETIDYQSYIKKIHDNYDNLSINDVIYSKIDTSVSGHQTINYIIQDHAGNETSKDIQVTVKQPVTIDNSSSIQKKSDNVSDESKKNSTPNKKRTPSPKNKYFDGYSIDVYNEALEYAENNSVRGYEIMPDGNGFQVTFY